MEYKKLKINSINKNKRRHSILREFGSFLEELQANRFLVTTGEITSHKTQPIERIEIRGFDTTSRKNYITLRGYSNRHMQGMKVYSRIERFSEVITIINDYCQRNPIHG
jgi:hypothetical protein